MAEFEQCVRCQSGPVHAYDNARQCENCGAYTDGNHHPGTGYRRISAAAIPYTSGRSTRFGELDLLSARQLIPDLDLTL